MPSCGRGPGPAPSFCTFLGLGHPEDLALGCAHAGVPTRVFSILQMLAFRYFSWLVCFLTVSQAERWHTGPHKNILGF